MAMVIYFCIEGEVILAIFCSVLFFRPPDMALNTEYLKSAQGILKILEFVSVYVKSNLLSLDF